MRAKTFLSLIAVSAFAIPFGAQADGGGDIPAKQWLESIQSTKSRAEVRATISGPTALRGGDDRGAIRWLRSIRSTMDERNEFAERASANPYRVIYTGA